MREWAHHLAVTNRRPLRGYGFLAIFSVLVLVVLLVLFSGASANTAVARAASITVVMDDSYPPYIFRDANGQVQGILKDTWALWSQRTGIAVDLQAMDWGKAQTAIKNGEADVIDTLFETEQRKLIYAFSPPSATIEVPIFFHKSLSGITDAASLRGFSVGVKDGDACIETLQAQGVDHLKRYPSYEEMILAASQGESLILCIDKPPAVYFINKLGMASQFRFSAPLYVGEFHRAVRKGDEALLQWVEEGFAQITPAELQAIEQKWLGAAVAEAPNQLAGLKRNAAYVLAALLTLTLLLMVWNRMLRRRVAANTRELKAALSSLTTANQLAERSRDHLVATLEAIPDLLFVMDNEGRYWDCRARRVDLLVAPPEQLLGHTVHEVMPAQAARVVMASLAEAAAQGTAQGGQICLPLSTGESWFELSVARKKSLDGEGLRFIVLSRDITERKQAQAEIEHLAFFDALTGLPNRRLLLDRLQHALAASTRYGTYGALMFIDLDHFKVLNDTRGHVAGDLLLQEVAQRLRASVRGEDSVARLGGDEFVLMLQGLAQDAASAAAQVAAVGEQVLSRLSQVYLLDGFQHHCTASIGVSLFCGDGQDVGELLKCADAAMYAAKNTGRNALAFFDPAMQATLQARAELGNELREALQQGQLQLYYQAQINSEHGVVGAEILLRWPHPVRGMVSPAQFIPLAEDNGLIVPIGQWVLEQACAQLQAWQKHPLASTLPLSVNVSARQFRQPDFVEQVRQCLQRSGIDPAQLKLELTESLVLDNVESVIGTMHALKALGVRFSMDDFGTGYSSLSYLKRLPLDQLKIDQSFVRDIVTDPGDAVIVKTIIGMAHNLGLEVIAEGVETEAQRQLLLDYDCRMFQGYLFGRPLPLAEFEALLQRMAAPQNL
ncbi:MAG: EAL domain-containing protein [Pseudomonadaceae bacterium]|nr:EAL domain-containing protein [Pseudomonadaceae bacterium]